MLGRSNKSHLNQPISVPFRECPAKTFQSDHGLVYPGRSVLEHCLIVGEIAKEIIARFPPTLAGHLFPNGSPLVCAAHDLGKISPYFVEKIRRNCTDGHHHLPARTDLDVTVESTWGGHAGVSQVAAMALQAPLFVPEILGQHHGSSPSVGGKRADDETFGGPQWQKEREGLIAELRQHFRLDWPKVVSFNQAWLLGGLTSVADWIGSGEPFEDPTQPWQGAIDQALDEAGFCPPVFQMGLTFEGVFGFPPRPIQERLIQQVTRPGVYVLEAPMGLGKTEAALFTAYGMLQSGQARGIYFALPTQLTSNKLHERFDKFLRSILAKDNLHRSLLLHSRSWLLEDTEMGEEGRPGGSWFNQAKRGLLAPFAVGTIDQALMAAMNVKHGFVRAFGLAGKVVILDEVHTYDAYTGTLLDQLVKLLQDLHATVIILSATLNRDRRGEMLNTSLSGDAYPLITSVPETGLAKEIHVPLETHQKVFIHLNDDNRDTIEEALSRALEGQQVLWIENTVNEAQDRYLDLAARATDQGTACGLLHSRFTAHDRQRIEEEWVDLFGKAGHSRRLDKGRILVGTQVLEQSLDLDADFLVSRFAPTDMLLQRMGRLWRHEETPRVASAVCEAWVLSEDFDLALESPVEAFGVTAFVYNPYVLCRSLEVWLKRKVITLPGDIRTLVEETYSPRDESPEWVKLLHELDNGTKKRIGRKALHQLAMVALAQSGKTLPESKAQTRYSETDSQDVLLLREVVPLSQQRASRLTFLNGEQHLLPWDRHRLSKRQWRKLSVDLMRQLVPVRVHEAPLPLPIDTLTKLGFHHCFYLGHPSYHEATLRVALVDETNALHGFQNNPIHEKHRIEYRDDLGYRVIKH